MIKASKEFSKEKGIGDLFQTYFSLFLHPFKNHEKLRGERLSTQKSSSDSLKIVDEVNSDARDLEEKIKAGGKSLSFSECVGISWIFALFKAMYTLITIHLGVHLFNFVSSKSEFQDLFLSNIKYSGQKIVIFWVLLEVVFFPILVWFYIKFWSVIIRFFVNLFETDSSEESLNQVLNHSLSANVFLLIPVFGDFIKHISSLLFIFAGLRKNLGMTQLQSLLVMISPLFLFMGLVMMSFVYIIMMFSMLY